MASRPGDVLSLTDDSVAEILIRLPTLEDLGRACVACPAFRRVITGHSFLRRLRALYPPNLLGILSNIFTPPVAPHPYAAAARDFADAAVDFSCSFLPSPERWHRCDLRDGRILLSAEGSSGSGALASDLVVCDPMHRRHLLRPAIPGDLVALADQQETVEFEHFLAPDHDGNEGGNSFKVICLVQCKTKLLVFDFASGSGQWHASEFGGWCVLTAKTSNPDPDFQPELSKRCYAHGYFCWVMPWMQKLIVLDTRTIEFSSMDIPPAHPMYHRAVVEAGERKFGIVTLHIDVIAGSEGPMSRYRLLYTVLRNNNQGANQQQQPDEIITLPSKHRYNIMGVARGYFLVKGIPEDLFLLPLAKRPALGCYSVDLKTFQLELFCETQHAILLAQLYVGLSLSLSPPTI